MPVAISQFTDRCFQLQSPALKLIENDRLPVHRLVSKREKKKRKFRRRCFTFLRIIARLVKLRYNLLKLTLNFLLQASPWKQFCWCNICNDFFASMVQTDSSRKTLNIFPSFPSLYFAKATLGADVRNISHIVFNRMIDLRFLGLET